MGLLFHFVKSIIITVFCEVGTSVPFCRGFNNLKYCCSGYYWDPSSNKCTACRAGTIGINCSRQCPYPVYGVNCQFRCGCYEKDCHYAYGCGYDVKSESNVGIPSIYSSKTTLPLTNYLDAENVTFAMDTTQEEMKRDKQSATIKSVQLHENKYTTLKHQTADNQKSIDPLFTFTFIFIIAIVLFFIISGSILFVVRRREMKNMYVSPLYNRDPPNKIPIKTNLLETSV